MKLSVFHVAGWLALAPCVLLATGTEDTPSLDSLRQSYDQSVQKHQIGSGAVLLGKLDEYPKALTALADKLQKVGDLEGILAVRQEQERFAKDKQIPSKPARDTPAEIAKLQTDYRNSISQIETDEYSGLLALTEKYVARINALKKQFTVQGDIDEALKMKAEADRVKSSAPVAAAEFALAERGIKTAATASSGGAGVSEGQETVPCTRCNGTGHVAPSDCVKCGGTGRCSSCGGRGMVPSALKGTRGSLKCITCKGTGKCRYCSDPDKQPDCAFCGGTGKVAKPAPPRGRQPPPSTSVAVGISPKERPADSPVKGLADAELDQYLETMSTLHKQFQSGTVTAVEADKVFAGPLKYTGKILQSKVYLVSGHPRGVRVAPSYDTIPQGGNLLIPYSLDVGNKAQSTAKAVGANGEVVITYGVVNKDNITLFAVSR